MLPFHPESDLLDARAVLRQTIDIVLTKLAAGVLPDDAELEHVDIKEEAGRRGSGGVLLAGQTQNTAAAAQLADEVACFGNTPGGGALIVGVENRSGDLLGTALDVEWLRHGIYQRVDLAPVVESRDVNGVRLLVLYVAASREPVEDTHGRIRWRVGSNCEPVDRSEWWLHRQRSTGHDSMAASTSRTTIDVSPGAVVVARRYLDQGGEDVATLPVSDLLQRIGVLRPDGFLTQAGALLFCATDRTYISLSVIEVEGGDVLLRPPDLAGLAVLEQLAVVEERIASVNTEVTVRGEGFTDSPVRRLPSLAVREAVLNGLVHRDWMAPEPVSVTWWQADSALQVISPGGFTGGITADTVLTQRFAKHPALADVCRALTLVDKQGLGVDRMYREMIALGHRPPMIVEEDGPRVRLRLVGGRPIVPVMALVASIEPTVRRRDVRVALVVDSLLRRPFATPEQMAPVLQRSAAEAAEALDTVAECRVGRSPLLVRHKDVRILSDAALHAVESRSSAADRRAREILPYRRPDDPAAVVREWLACHDRITSGDYATLTGLTQTGALNHLDRLVSDAVLVRGEGKGRNAHFRAG